ncbi:hypothetical protein P43SY_005147 [Pythium insidiosum]|uniref:Uncharacterized protein n=1 Tax=Pythium insidiosum TaxID=114742 RepID=A0AAD5M3C9_PYTIN|nr:hypothetical protein P43SY_005147 [Pythium insidiosum]KAJ0396444.1 hypothetical protein ATCC90586_000387 [Pythium insidiosum]
MVAGPASDMLADDGCLPAGITTQNKCRYKTGKCTNARSAKRNGHLHQLCLYHREKANKIQRKFDRQKRQLARMKKADGGSGRDRSASVASSCDLAFPMLNSPSSFSSLSAQDVEIYSDSDSSRFSTDSDSSLASLDQLWNDLPDTAMLLDLDGPVSSAMRCYSAPPSSTASNSSQLSHDEIDFLCSAMLE